MSESARNIPYLSMHCPVCGGMRGWFDRFNSSYYIECWMCKGHGQLRIYYTLVSPHYWALNRESDHKTLDGK